MYEALRAYFVEDRPSADVAKAFGYTPGSFRVLCHQFRRDEDPTFFVKALHGPRSQPKKSAARDLIVELRKQNHSVYEISEELKSRRMLLSPTAVREVLKEEGFAPLPRRLDEERPYRLGPTAEPVADVRSLSLSPRTLTTSCGSGSPDTAHQIRNHIVPAQFRWKFPKRTLVISRPIDSAR
jgi:hypothetical protein